MPNAHAAIRMFAICSAMRWAHLPVAGGIYDQHPELLEKFRYIFERQGQEQERERQRREADQRRGMGNNGMRPSARAR